MGLNQIFEFGLALFFSAEKNKKNIEKILHVTSGKTDNYVKVVKKYEKKVKKK